MAFLEENISIYNLLLILIYTSFRTNCTTYTYIMLYFFSVIFSLLHLGLEIVDILFQIFLSLFFRETSRIFKNKMTPTTT